ncbi:MAG: site-2 protease family protein [Candidatus Aminicenantes bacterium]|nr:site-2 protease family protein [Candidatus Aminicenantes bacterium]
MSIIDIIIRVFVLLFALSVHEAAHAWTALKLGDPTASHMGRITLNPIAHIDPMGTIIFPLILIVMRAPFLFGYAKPVPVNPLNLRNPKRDNLLISAAGPLSNLAVAVIAFIGIIILKFLDPNLFVSRARFSYLILLILYNFIILNVILATFNLIPVPPLDGSGVLMGFLSDESAQKYDQIRPYGMIIIIVLWMTGVLRVVFSIVLGIVDYFINLI